MDKLLYGVAYYDEYIKEDRIKEDMKMMKEANINVIIGTPTYAIPTWLYKLHPEVLATTNNGKNKYVQGKTWTLQAHHTFFMPSV